MEEFKFCPGFSNYRIYNDGRVFNIKTNTFLKLGYASKGYKRAFLINDNKVQKIMLIHRLVAIAFIDNPESKETVNHKNEINDDNRVENLEWMSNYENLIHSWRNGKKGRYSKYVSTKKEKVIHQRPDENFMKEIPKYKDLFITKDAKIWSDRNTRYLKLNTNPYGYLRINIGNSKRERETFTIHRLVATAFIPNPQNKKTVNHINGIKKDNRIENLEWMTNEENTSHAHKTGLNPGFTNRVDTSIKILNTKTGIVYKSVKEAAESENLARTSLCLKLNGTRINNTNFIYYK